MLWKTLFSKWDLPEKLLSTPFKKSVAPLEIHLYKFSFLPEIYHRFFEKVSEHCSVHYYQFSPCNAFWTDIFSEKERFHVEKMTDPRVRNEWASYLSERPLLLANLGHLARQTFRFFEESDFSLDEAYQPPSSTSLLHQVQRDILEFQMPEKKDIKEDESITLYSASSKRREVEILYDTLLERMKKNHFNPSDIRIFAPDISSYAPFISLIFGAKESPFPFSISDLPFLHGAPLLQAFLNLLSLTKDRFKKDAVLRLFSSESFRKRFALKEKEVEAFAMWMEKGGVKWGVDRTQRSALLGGEEMLETGETGTWEETFKRTLLGFTKIPKVRPTWERPLLDFSDAEVFGKGVAIIRDLQKDMEDLLENSRSLASWSAHLKLLLSRYFQPGEEDLYAYQWIEKKITLLESESLPDYPFSFSSIYHYLKVAFQEKSGKQEASQIEALSFSSLKLAVVDDASLICLLGLDENAFPRVQKGSSLCELDMKQQPKAQEEDRHLFLEVLFASKTELMMSYVNVNEEDGKEQAPSPLIEELFSYLDKVCTIEQKKPSTVLVKNAPPFCFHADHFKREKLGAKLPFLAARKFYESKKGSSSFIPEFLDQKPSSHLASDNLTVDLKQLSRFAKHPLRFYLNHALHLYLEYEEKDEEFTLSPLVRALVHKEVGKRPLKEVFKEADLHGKLPLGRFKDVAWLNTSEEMQKVAENLKEFDLSEEESHSVELLPPFELSLGGGRHATVTGTLLDVTSKGMLFHGEKKLDDLLKIWPLFLVFACVEGNSTKELLLTKTGERVAFPGLNPFESLKNYLLYYEKALHSPSPLLPSWGASFLEKGADHLEKKIEVATDPYVQRVFHQNSYSASHLHATWAPLLKTTFKSLQEGL